jgi:hypothetical protein
MRKNIKQLILTEKSIGDIKPDDVVAITLASGGAMGDPGAVEITDKNLNVYYTHLSEISSEKLERIVPFIKKIDDIFADIWVGDKVEIDGDWAGLYMGFGNCLFVRPELKEPMLNYIKANYTECSSNVELYTHWYDTLKEVVKKDAKMDKETEAKIKELNQIWDSFFEDLTAELSKECKDFVKTKEGRSKFMHWYFKGDHDEYPWAFFTEENMK